jgi:hypothetical protein
LPQKKAGQKIWLVVSGTADASLPMNAVKDWGGRLTSSGNLLALFTIENRLKIRDKSGATCRIESSRRFTDTSWFASATFRAIKFGDSNGDAGRKNGFSIVDN